MTFRQSMLVLVFVNCDAGDAEVKLLQPEVRPEASELSLPIAELPSERTPHPLASTPNTLRSNSLSFPIMCVSLILQDFRSASP